MEWYRTRRPTHCEHYLLCVPTWIVIFLIRPLELSGSNQERDLVAKQEKLGEKWPWLLSTKYLFHTPQGSLTCVKSYDNWLVAILPVRRKSSYGFLLTLKIHRPRPGLKTQTLGPVPLNHRGRLQWIVRKHPLYETSGSHGGEYEYDCLVGCFAVYSRKIYWYFRGA
jgi:hypothetical protein